MAEKEKEKPEKSDKAAKQKAAGLEKAKAAKKAKEDGLAVATAEDLKTPAPPARLYDKYKAEIVPALKEKFGLKNTLAVPRLEKIVISMGLGKAVTSGEKGRLETAEKELAIIAGQKPVRCKAKKSVANFKVREGQETGLKVTLRGTRMYEFLDRTITLAFPRVKDFRGVNPASFDKAGNFNFGFTEQSVFPEVNVADIQHQQGMNITIVTTAEDVEQGRELLRAFGMPFSEASKQGK